MKDMIIDNNRCVIENIMDEHTYITVYKKGGYVVINQTEKTESGLEYESRFSLSFDAISKMCNHLTTVGAIGFKSKS